MVSEVRGPRPSWSSLAQFVHIISNLDGAVNRGHKQTDLIIMDFAKAFDKVPHRRLLHKLDCYGIRGSVHKWINSWLSGRALTPLFGNWAGAHGIGKISGVLTKIGKFDIVLMYAVSIARLIPLIKLTSFLDI